MNMIGYGYSKNLPPKGHVRALKCDNRFYVITKAQYDRILERLRVKPVFLTDLPVYIDGINI